MSYQKYNDPAKLLLDICQPNWNEMSPQEVDDLLAEMSELGLEMSKDKTFKHDYVKATKEIYLSYINKQKKGDYMPPLFKDLDNEIRKRIGEKQKETAQTEVLIPEYLSTPSQNLSSHAQSVKAKIALMHAKRNKQLNPEIINPNQRK